MLRCCMQDADSHRRNFQRQIEDVTAKIKRTEAALRSATTDYILARRDKQTAEARAITAEDALQQERDKAARQVCTSPCSTVVGIVVHHSY
jgi:coiled-coil domain-containing protein 77